MSNKRDVPPGTQVGAWTTISQASKFGSFWSLVARHTCGRTRTLNAYNLVSGRRAPLCDDCGKEGTAVSAVVIGAIFGRWTVVGPRRRNLRLCRCVCGTERMVSTSALLRRESTQCIRCFRARRRFVTEIGQVYGEWTVTGGMLRSSSPVRCRCGVSGWRVASTLIKGTSRSCGACGTKDRWDYTREEAGLRLLYSRYKSAARKMDRPFELNIDQFHAIVSSHCTYCASPPTQVERRAYSLKPAGVTSPRFAYNGIDRRDSSKGYSVENCSPCCGVCNMMKRHHTEQFFVEHMKRIMGHLKLEVA